MKFRLVLCVVVGLLFCAPSWAQYSEGFDDDSADVTINQQADTAVTFLDYGAELGLPEAPRPVAGSVATRGVQLEANLANGAATGVNIVAGATPANFSGNYRLSYDVFLSFGGTTGTTEQLLWGVGNDDSDPIEARNNRGS